MGRRSSDQSVKILQRITIGMGSWQDHGLFIKKKTQNKMDYVNTHEMFKQFKYLIF